ncbi:hypothetical protein [Flavobacterium ammonificans]|uniref:Uncharacterized protein n=1 Tax=Flavobacterium ammonificans TaxID=1751056 RepID=A0ABN6KSS6_9FLAO|nr:hypothetical protein [Flavobacterium ammonificans]BDB52199.1 hypothetical protein GENT11_05110 [Flavobacterium ammonificans]
MKYIFAKFFLLISLGITAQTGIGTTTPNASARLEVAASDRGFLPPRVALTATNAFSPIVGTAANATGLLVYNTATTTNAPNNVAPGYYYWNGTAWIQISGGLVIESRSASFSLSAADNNKLFFINSASTVTVTVPSLPIGFSCQLIQVGAGTIRFAPESGTTLNSASGLSTRTTNSVIGLVMNSATVGYVFGDTIF